MRRCHGAINSTGKLGSCISRMTSPSTSGNQNSKWLDNITKIIVGKWNDCGFFSFEGLTICFILVSFHCCRIIPRYIDPGSILMQALLVVG